MSKRQFNLAGLLAMIGVLCLFLGWCHCFGVFDLVKSESFLLGLKGTNTQRPDFPNFLGILARVLAAIAALIGIAFVGRLAIQRAKP